MCARIFLSQHQVLYQKIGLCGVSSCLQGPKWDEKRHFWAGYAEEGETGGQTGAENPPAAHCTGGAAGVRALPPVGCRLGHSTLYSLRSLRFRGSGRILLAQQAQRGRRWNADPTGKTRNNLNNFFTAGNTPADSKRRAVARRYKSCFHKVVSNTLPNSKTPRSESNQMPRFGCAEHKPQR